MKTILTVAFFLVASSASVFAADTAPSTTVTNDRNTVDKSCSNEGKVAKCGNDVVGKALFDCIGAYKKANPDTFKISSACKTAIDKLHADKKAGK